MRKQGASKCSDRSRSSCDPCCGVCAQSWFLRCLGHNLMHPLRAVLAKSTYPSPVACFELSRVVRKWFHEDCAMRDAERVCLITAAGGYYDGGSGRAETVRCGRQQCWIQVWRKTSIASLVVDRDTRRILLTRWEVEEMQTVDQRQDEPQDCQAREARLLSFDSRRRRYRSVLTTTPAKYNPKQTIIRC